LRRARRKYTAEDILRIISVALELPEPELRFDGRPLDDYRSQTYPGTFYVDNGVCDFDAKPFNNAPGPRLRGIGHRTLSKPELERAPKVYFPQSDTRRSELDYVNFYDPKYREAILRYRLRYAEMYGFPPSVTEIRWYIEDLEMGMFEYDPQSFDDTDVEWWWRDYYENEGLMDIFYFNQSADQINFPPQFYKGLQLDQKLVDKYMALKYEYDYYYSAPNPALLGPRPREDLFQQALESDPIPQYPDITAYGTLEHPNLNVTPVPTPTPVTLPPGTSPPVTSAPTFLRSLAPVPAPRSLRYQPQAQESLHAEKIESTHDQQQIMTFSDDTNDWVESIIHAKDDSFYAADTGDVSLADFFSRPIKIAQYPWAVNATTFYQQIDPWTLFFNNPRVINRIVNYKNLRCNLNIKIVLNGSQFHFGRLMASYNPLPTLDDFSKNRGIAPYSIVDLIEASQRPHLYLDPCTSQGGTMELPYFYYNNSLEITLGEWNVMGQLTLQQLSPLKHCQGVVDDVTVSVFAWASEVVLSSPTCLGPGALAAQSRDEYSGGVISKPAAILASIAGKLRSVPYIGPYAHAAQIGAEGVGAVAKIFGYCKPNVVTDPIMNKPELVTTLANTNRSDAISKLTFDIKSNVTVDPRTTGLGPIDEMTISSIATRESYLTSFPWTIAALPEQLLFNIVVTPSIWNIAASTAGGGSTELHVLPCAFASLPFRYWRGTLRYRFQVVCSSFHKGRLRFVYDPIQQDPAVPIAEYNTNMSHVVDIALENDFILEVGWNSNYTHLQCSTVGSLLPTTMWNALAQVNGIAGFTNGVLSCYVMSQLTSSGIGTNNDISVNVFVSAGEDFEVFDPVERAMQSYAYFPQSHTVQGHSEQSNHTVTRNMEDASRDAPEGAVVLRTFGNKLQVTDSVGIVCHGDPVVSIRNLIKRYTFHETFAPTATGLLNFTVNTPAFPKYKGTAPGAIHLKGALAYNYTHMTPLNYFAPAFAGRRGSIRNKIVLITQNASTIGSYGRLTRSITQAHLLTNTIMPVTTVATYGASMKVRLNTTTSGWAGSSLSPLAQEPVIEGEIPYHNRFRFTPSRFANNTTLENFSQGMTMEAMLPVNISTPTYFDRYVAAGDDYSLFWFISVPVMYYNFLGFT